MVHIHVCAQYPTYYLGQMTGEESVLEGRKLASRDDMKYDTRGVLVHYLIH